MQERPLTESERLIWAGQRLSPEAPLYNMALAVAVEERLEADVLAEAVERVVRSADALRTVVRVRDGEPVALVLPDAEVALDLVDLDGSAWEDGSLRSAIEERARRKLSCDRPMIDVALYRGPDRSVLFINQHHLITDAFSKGVLYRRLSDTYQGLLDGTLPDLAAAPQFEPYARRLAENRDAPELERARGHWGDEGPGRLESLGFYGVRSSGEGRTERIRVPLDEARVGVLASLIKRPEFRAFSRAHSRLLVFATVLAAWASRLTDQRRVTIGVPFHNRTTKELRDTLGLFMELYPLRLRLDEGSTFASLARDVAAGTIEMMRHAVPGASAVAGARGYGVVLNYITAVLGDFAGIPTRTDWVHTGYGDPAHAVRLPVHDFDDSGALTLDFDLDVSVFGPRERAWAVDHFLALFDALAADPAEVVAEVPLVTWEDEAAFAPRGAEVEPGPGLLASFGGVVSQHPDDVAVVDGSQEVTYRQLAARALALADRLSGALSADEVVGVCLGRGTDQIAAVLGVLRCAAAYLPLDPSHPDERLSLQVEDAGVRLVVTSAEDADRVRAWGVNVLVLEGLRTDQGVEPGQTVGGSASTSSAWSDRPPDSLAYVLYTSGSTGRPKGVEVTHASLSDYLAWAQRTYDRGDRLRWAWFTSSAYDLSLTSMLTPLVSGGTVVVYPDVAEGGGLLVREVFTDDRVDVVKLTPSHLELVRDLDLTRCPVRRLIVGGENLRTSVARAAQEALGPDVELYNEYGPTESTVACMIHRFDPESDVGSSVSIGVPADNARVHVLGPGGWPTVRGESGEICVSGPRVARGYRGLPDLTAEVFVADPLDPAQRMYRTGDRGRWNAEGTLDFLGRDDDQVKVGGVRLELAEVEAAVTCHPKVREAAAIVVEADRLDTERRCRACGLEAGHPEARIGEDGVCQLCARFERERREVDRYFGALQELEARLADARAKSAGPHDTIMLYSGGEDSTYALCRIVDLGAHPLVFFFDNGFMSDQAKANVRRVTDMLGLELMIGTTPAMPEIFSESLRRFSNVCQGCLKTVYTLALNLAVERGISAIVTGSSRGRIFETQLADLFRRRVYDAETVDRAIDEARRAYHRMGDAVAPLVDTGSMTVDDALDTVDFIDFYRYADVEPEDRLEYVRNKTPWMRPPDGRRSKDCLINEAGVFVHLAERGFHNYSLAYSWDVRLGHKRRDAAVEELDDQLDPARVRRMLDEVGYRERSAPSGEARLVAYYVGDEEVPTEELRRVAARRLPQSVLPSSFVRLDEMPLTDHGKVKRDALPVPGAERPAIGTPFIEPFTPRQWQLAEIWSEVLGLGSVGIHDDFFELGGESMRCIQVVALARERGLALTPRDLFRHPTIAELSEIVTTVDPLQRIIAAEVSAEELASLSDEFGG